MGASNVLTVITQMKIEVNRKIKTVTNTANNNKVKIASHERRLTDLEKGEISEGTLLHEKLTGMTTIIAALETNGRLNDTAVAEPGPSSTNHESYVEKKFKEMRDEEDRKNNIVIHNAAESKGKTFRERVTDDVNLVKDLCQVGLGMVDFHASKIVKVTRLGKQITL